MARERKLTLSFTPKAAVKKYSFRVPFSTIRSRDAKFHTTLHVWEKRIYTGGGTWFFWILVSKFKEKSSHKGNLKSANAFLGCEEIISKHINLEWSVLWSPLQLRITWLLIQPECTIRRLHRHLIHYHLQHCGRPKYRSYCSNELTRTPSLCNVLRDYKQWQYDKPKNECSEQHGIFFHSLIAIKCGEVFTLRLLVLQTVPLLSACYF